MPINFFSEGIKFSLRNKEKIQKWILRVARAEKHKVRELNFIFCPDKYLLTLNKKFLKHHYYTDIISFNYSEKKNEIDGEIFISLPQVKRNAKKYKTDFSNEIHRVIIHGVLHLCGYDDKTEKEKNKMREKENQYLNF